MSHPQWINWGFLDEDKKVMADAIGLWLKLDEKTRAMMKKGSKHLRHERDEEQAAKLLEEVQERRLQLEDEM